MSFARKLQVIGISLGCLVLFSILYKTDYLYGKVLAKQGVRPLADIGSIEDAILLFPQSVEDITTRVQAALEDAQQRISDITLIEDSQRTFANTVKAFDELCSLSDLMILIPTLQLLEMVSPDKAIRDAAHESYLKLQDFNVDTISNNVELYKALKAYAGLQREKLSVEEQYFLDEVLRDFKRAGLDLPEDELDQVKQLKKKINQLTADFNKNIAADATQLFVSKEDLRGLDEDFINNLKQTDEGLYVLTLEYPTYFAVMQNCSVAETRRKMDVAFHNRAYPINEDIFKDLIESRDQLAKRLGFSSYAALDMDGQMIKSPEKASTFLNELNNQIVAKVSEEVELLMQELPESVELSKNGKIWPWDTRYLTNQYKKKYLNVDETTLAEYFPMESTIEGLLDIYRQFLGVDFVEVPVSGLWHEDVKCVAVSRKGSGKITGYVFLDLHPRPNKYSHACHGGIVPATYDTEGNPTCGVSILIANFPKSTAEKPSLLKRDDVEVFFHEFGHAIHSRLGRTHIGCFAGTSVKTDFVEMPSQMLEEWLWDKDILKKLSCYYKTKESLSDEAIDAIVNLKNFCIGNWIHRQVMLSQISLQCYLEGKNKNPYEILMELYKEFSPATEIMKENHKYCSFIHLSDYGSKYYSYLWSRVFAVDLFDTIKQHGLLDEEIGQKYVQDVLSKGGSQDPNELLQNFLGREPSQDAFLKSIGVRT